MCVNLEVYQLKRYFHLRHFNLTLIFYACLCGKLWAVVIPGIFDWSSYDCGRGPLIKRVMFLKRLSVSVG